MLPILRTGESIILGEAVGLPMRTIIQAPTKDRRPDSHDPIVCDDLPPDLSTAPGGWGIKMEDKPNYEEFSLVWRQQNPRLPVSEPKGKTKKTAKSRKQKSKTPNGNKEK